MESSIWLRKMFSIAYYVMIFVWIIIFGILLYAIIFDSDKVMGFINNSKNISVFSRGALFTILAYALIAGYFWIYILKLIRNLMDSLMTGSLFTRFQIAGFKLIGQLLILFTIIDSIITFIFTIIFTQHMKINLTFSDFWLLIAIGLFLIFLSNIFKRGRLYKEENQLTI